MGGGGSVAARLPASDPRTVGLLFATTRAIVDRQSLMLITDDRSRDLSFGALQVRIPEAHRLGGVEVPWNVGVFGWTFYRQSEDPKEHFTIRARTHLSRASFIDSVKTWKADQALVFVHGFNNSFEDAAYRLAQLVWDTQFSGVPILFSWPSRGQVLAYWRDRESAIFSRAAFLELLQLLERDTQLSAVHVVAHSMGNQIVVEALGNAAAGALAKPLAEVILAAPDVDRDVFIGLAGPMLRFARGVTLYVSSADRALVTSRRIAQGARAGDVPTPPLGPIVMTNIDTIDVTAVGSDFFSLNHDTALANRALIDELGRLIKKSERPPSGRTPQLRGVPEGEKPKYWRYVE